MRDLLSDSLGDFLNASLVASLVISLPSISFSSVYVKPVFQHLNTQYAKNNTIALPAVLIKAAAPSSSLPHPITWPHFSLLSNPPHQQLRILPLPSSFLQN